MKHRALIVFAAMGILLMAAPAQASWGDIFSFEFGLKGMGGYNYWNKPANSPLDMVNQDVLFGNERSGFGAGGGLYLQLRFFKFVGLELDVLFENDEIWEHPLEGYDWKINAQRINVRLPLLVQFILPLKPIRLGLVIGPEFVLPFKTWAEQSYIPPEFKNYDFKTSSPTTTRLTFGINLAIRLAEGIYLPIDIRASYDVTQPRSWAERIFGNPACMDGDWAKCGKDLYAPDGSIGIIQRNTWDFRLLLGIGFDFPAILGLRKDKPSSQEAVPVSAVEIAPANAVPVGSVERYEDQGQDQGQGQDEGQGQDQDQGQDLE